MVSVNQQIRLLTGATLFAVLNGAHAVNRNTMIPVKNGLTATPNTPISNATTTIAFSSAVQIASSISRELTQLASIPAIPIPTDITNITGHAVVSRLAPAMPPIQAGINFPDADGMVADLISWTNISSTGNSLAGRQAALRVMVVGDSIS